MAASQDDIRGWFLEGKKDGKTHMLVVCDTFDWEDYPVYATTEKKAREEYDKHHQKDMQKVMEVYNLSQDMEEQLRQPTSMNW